MESNFEPTDSSSSRPKRPLPAGSIQSYVDKQTTTTAPTTSADLGGTLVPQASEEIPDLSTDSDDDEGSGSKRRKGKNKSSLPRRQIKIEYIQDKSRRNITFGKRKNGIFKKAQEISTLTGCEVMLIVASKDSELQAFTYATTRLQPLVTEPASEAYIQNCLRYGALMPGAPSAINNNYGQNATSRQGSHISTLNTGPRASPVPIQHGNPHTNLYPFGHNNPMARRPPPYGLPQGIPSSPQSGANSMSHNRATRPIGISEDMKPEVADSPSQNPGSMTSGSQHTKSPWPVGNSVAAPELHASSPSAGVGNGVVPAGRDMLNDWNVAQTRHIFQASPSLGAMPVSSRGLSPFQLPANNSGTPVCYPNSTPSRSPFQRPPAERSIVSDSPWQASPTGIHSMRPAPGTPINPNSNQSVGTTTPAALEPLVLSQPFDHRSVSSSGDGPLSAGPTNTSGSLQINIQSSISQYGDCDSYESICPPSAYFNDENDPGTYRLDATEQPWNAAIH